MEDVDVSGLWMEHYLGVRCEWSTLIWVCYEWSILMWVPYEWWINCVNIQNAVEVVDVRKWRGWRPVRSERRGDFSEIPSYLHLALALESSVSTFGIQGIWYPGRQQQFLVMNFTIINHASQCHHYHIWRPCLPEACLPPRNISGLDSTQWQYNCIILTAPLRTLSILGRNIPSQYRTISDLNTLLNSNHV